MNDVQPFVFGRAETQAPVMLSGINRLGERLGRRLRFIIEPLAGVKPEITVQPAEFMEHSAWAESAPGFCSFGMYRLAPLKGNVVVRLDAAMVSTLVDRFYGGTGARPLAARGEFTPTEERLIARLDDAVMTQLVECWADTLPLEAMLVGRENGPGAAPGAQAGDQVAVQRFVIVLGALERWSIDIAFPLAALRTAEPFMDAKVRDDGTCGDPVWQSMIARQMANIRLPARTVLARPNLTLAELMELRPGDVIPVHIGSSLPLIVGDRVIAQGTIGEQDGRAAFMIEKLS